MTDRAATHATATHSWATHSRTRLALAAGLAAWAFAGCGSGSGSFIITDPPGNVVYAEAAPVYTACVAAGPNSPTFAGFVQSWSITPPLPSGLAISPTDGAIAGTPTAGASPTLHTVTASGPGGSASAEILVEVLLPAPPANLTYDAPAPTYNAGTAIVPNAPILDGVASAYDVTPTLPSGLQIDPQTGILSGTPQAAVGTTTFTVRASNCLGDETTFGLDITVVEPGPGAGIVPRFLFVANEDDGTVSRLGIDPVRGSSRHLGYVPVPAGPRALALSPDGTRLFCLSAATPSVSVFSIAPSDGHAVAVPGSPFDLPPGSGPRGLATSADGARLYVTLESSDFIAAFNVSAQGTLSEIAGSPVSVVGTGSGAQGPRELVLSSAGDRLFATLNGSNSVVSFALSGAGLPVSAGANIVAVGAGPRSLVRVAGNTGQTYLVCANTAGGSLSSIAVDAGGALALVNTGNFGGGSLPDGLATRQAGIFPVVYVTVTGFGFVARAGMNPQTGELFAPQTTGQTGPAPATIALAADNSTAFVVYTGSSELATVFQDVSGNLTTPTAGGSPLGRVRVRPGARALALLGSAAPLAIEDTALYSANFDVGELSQFDFDAAVDQLTALAPATVDGGAAPNVVRAHPRLDRVYVADQSDPGGADLRVYPIGTGGALGAPALFEIGDVAGGSGSIRAVEVDPAGRFLFAVRFADPGDITTYSLCAAGDPSAVSTAATGANASSVAVDPTGQIAVVGERFDNVLRGFRIDPGTGTLAPLAPPTVPTGVSPFAVAFHPSGRFAYAANRSSGSLSAYTVDAATGALAPLVAVDIALGSNPNNLVFEPLGRFLFVATEGLGTIERFAINLDPADGVADGTPVLLSGPVFVGVTLRGLAVNGAGTRLFASVQGTGEVRFYSFDAAGSGELTLAGQSTAGPGARSLALRRRYE